MPKPKDSSSSSDPNVPKKPKEMEPESLIVIPPPNIVTIRVKILGTSPLICSSFPDKLLTEMEEKRLTPTDLQQKKKHAVRDFDKEFRESLYPWPDGKGYGFPAIAFKRAMVGACRHTSLDMTTANRLIFVKGEAEIKGFSCVPLECKPPRNRRDAVRVGSGMNKQPDVRFRAEFFPWACWLTIEFLANILSQAGVLNLLMHAGITEGVGEMRRSAPKKPFDFGCFTISEGR